jgi:outer membrane receptor protein involved in Fe transport
MTDVESYLASVNNNFDDFADLSIDDLLAEPVVVTGSKRAQKASQSLSTISVITREDIEASPYLYLGELLGTLPGLDVRWGQMQRLYVGMRGFGGMALNSRLLLLLDGQPLNDPLTGELAAGHFIPLYDIERIEVIRGPGSSLYGANAFSGVVNIISHSQNGKNAFEGVRASMLLGSNMTRQVQAFFSQNVGSFLLRGGAEAFGTEGIFPAAEVYRTDNTVKSVKNDDLRRASASLSGSYKGFRISARYIEGERGRPGQFPTDRAGEIRSCGTCHTEQSPYGKGIKNAYSTNSCGGCHMQSKDREYIRRGSVAAAYDADLGGGFHLGAHSPSGMTTT